MRKAARRRRKARERLPAQAVVALGAGLATVPVSGFWDVLAWTAAGFGAVGAVRSLGVLTAPAPAPLPALPPASAVAPPPPAGSAAFPAVRRLEAVRGEMARLLPLVPPGCREAAEEAWQAAAAADAALRWQAARLAAVEPHRGAEPALLADLEAGVAEQERVVAALADLVAAAADPGARGRLQDAADRLHGLAEGLRELR